MQKFGRTDLKAVVDDGGNYQEIEVNWVNPRLLHRKIISDLRTNMKSVILISHNLENVFQVADRICVLRRGELVGLKKKEETTKEEIVGLITGAIEGQTY